MYELESLNDNKIMVYYNNTLKIYGLNVLKVYEDKTLRDNLKKNAKKRAEDFNAENYAKKLLEVYDKAIKNKKTKGIIRKITNKIKGDK